METYFNRIFALENPVVGYQYEPGGASPEVKLKTFFGRDLAPDVLVCGPDLAIKRGDTVAFSGKVLRLDFKSVKVPDGWLLANGPVTGLSSRLGTGTCGACPLIHLDVMFLPEAHGSPSVVYAEQLQVEDEDVSSPSRNARVLLAEDLRSIQTWTAEPDDAFEKASWTFTQFCYEPGRHTYVECKKEGNVKPPAHVAMPHE